MPYPMNMVAMGIIAPIPRKTEVVTVASISVSAISPSTARVMITIIRIGIPTPKICT